MAKLKEIQARLAKATAEVEAEKAKAMEIIAQAKAKAAEAEARLRADLESAMKDQAESVAEDIGHAIGNLELDPDDVVDAVYSVQILKVDGAVTAKVALVRIGTGPSPLPRGNGRTRTPVDPAIQKTLPQSSKAELIRSMFYTERMDPGDIAKRMTESGYPTSGGEVYRAIGPIADARAKRGDA